MKHRNPLVAIILALLIISACGKDDSIDSVSRHRQLMDTKWQVDMSVSIDSNGNETDLYSSLQEYAKDDYFLFKADSTYELNDNVLLRADSVSLIIDAGRWELSSDGSHLEMYSNVFNTEYEPARIVELNSAELLLERSYPGDRSRIRTRYRAVP